MPQYQREYAWTRDEVREFWLDLQGGLEDPQYFLGLIILTDEESRKHVVDGQQRLLTLTLMAAILYHEAVRVGRRALAERLQADFLSSIDYDTDESVPRLILTDVVDESTLRSLVTTGSSVTPEDPPEESISLKLIEAHSTLRSLLVDDLRADPFKRLGVWADFLTNRVFFAVFLHPDPASAFRVFEVVNDRGRNLTTADLLKNYVLSQTRPADRDSVYSTWQSMARPLNQMGTSTLVQFIRHVVTLNAGHISPKELFDYLANRRYPGSRPPKVEPPTVNQLLEQLVDNSALYMQMIDPTLDGPSMPEWLNIFDALNELSVIAVRPILLAMTRTAGATDGMQGVLELVVRRIVVGNLGTGNIERRFSEAAAKIRREGSWQGALADLGDLNPPQTDFLEKAATRSFSKATLQFLRRSEIQSNTTPGHDASLHLIRPRQANAWPGFPADEFTFWGSTIGNTLLTTAERRPPGAASWAGVASQLLPLALDSDREDLRTKLGWSAEDVEERGKLLAQALAGVWYAE